MLFGDRLCVSNNAVLVFSNDIAYCVLVRHGQF